MARIIETLDDGTISVRLKAEIDRDAELRLVCNMLSNMKHSLGNRYLFDFSNVKYLSSESIEEWCRVAFAIVDSGGAVCCCGLNGLPQKVFELLGIRDLFRIFPNFEAAYEYLQELASESGYREQRVMKRLVLQEQHAL